MTPAKPMLTSIEVHHESGDAEVFRYLLPERHQGQARILGAVAIVHTYSYQASVRAVFTGIKANGQPFRGAVSRHLGYVDDEWLPTCFPDPAVRHLAQRLLDARREEQS